MTTHTRPVMAGPAAVSLMATNPASAGSTATSSAGAAIRRPLTLPAITPTSWELRLPDYPVISNSWRSTAFPELLGSLPSDARWSLRFENVTAAEALALMLPWKASGGGQWSLTTLPDALAGGVDDTAFRKRLTGTTWTMASPPQKESVKNGRFNVTIELVHELTFDSLYAFRNQPIFEESPLRLRLLSTLAIAGVPIALQRTGDIRQVSGVLDLDLSDGLTVAGANASPDRTPRRDAAASLPLDLSEGLTPIAVPVSLVRVADSWSAQGVLAVDLTSDLTPAATVP